MGGHERSWEVMGGHGRSWEVMGGHGKPSISRDCAGGRAGAPSSEGARRVLRGCSVVSQGCSEGAWRVLGGCSEGLLLTCAGK